MNLRTLTFPTALALALAGSLACNRESEAAKMADQAAQQEQARVAELQQELADAKAGKAAGGDDAETSKTLQTGHIKSLEKQLADAKKREAAKKKEAADLAAATATPKITSVTVPADTAFSVKLDQSLATDKQQAGDPWSGTLTAPVTVNGTTAWPAGTVVKGVVSQSVPAGRLSSGKGVLSIKVTAIGDNTVDTDTHAVTGSPKGERDAKFIGGGAALGALVGILSDKHNKNDHALGGAAIGAAAGTAVAAGTADTIIKIDAAAPLSFHLATAETVTLKN
ncbi:MAG TPA: hypothetical protein VL181_04530 [Holophagaceae bacterium]|jgi:hypothetical protein|nr:hypothetical protein [Holophagaceae bacterium]